MRAWPAATKSADPCSMTLNLHAWFQVQQLMDIVPDCPEFSDLLFTIRQVALARLCRHHSLISAHLMCMFAWASGVKQHSLTKSLELHRAQQILQVPLYA